MWFVVFFFFQAEDGIRDLTVTGVQTCALPILLENVRGTCPWVFKRRLRYAMHVDFTGAGRLERCPPEWFGRWEEAGIDMRSVVEEKYYWHDFEVLRYMNEYGARRFWLDDIWGFDWEACRLHAKRHTIAGVPDAPVNAPPRALVLAMRVLSARSEERRVGKECR